MAKAPAFTPILDRPVSATERPKPLPPGQYAFVVQSYREDKSTKKQTEFIEFTCKCLGPLNEASVDQEALDHWASSKSGEKKKLTDVTMKVTFYLTENSIYRLQDFLEHLGFEVSEGNASFKQMIAEAPGCQFVGTVTHESSKDGQMTYANVTSTAPMPA